MCPSDGDQQFGISSMQQILQDHYAVLGVPRTASDKEIKLAFHRKAKEYHPDTSTRFDANEMFSKLNRAYSVLKDKKKRQAYNVELMEDIFQEQIIDPARERVSGAGFTTEVAEDKWGWRAG